jgi:hypothetical protein
MFEHRWVLMPAIQSTEFRDRGCTMAPCPSANASVIVANIFVSRFFVLIGGCCSGWFQALHGSLAFCSRMLKAATLFNCPFGCLHFKSKAFS